MNNGKRGGTFEIFGTMRKVLLFVAVLCLLTAIGGTSTIADDGYVDIGESVDGTKYSLFVPSVEDRGEYIVGWVRVTNLTGESAKAIQGKKPHYNMTFYAANKDIRQYQILSNVFYDKKDTVISSYSDPYNPYNWKECVPNTMGESIYYAIKDANFHLYLEKNNIDPNLY